MPLVTCTKGIRPLTQHSHSINSCNDQANQKWQMSRGSTAVQLVGTNFCLDAGSTPANGVQMKIWQVGNVTVLRLLTASWDASWQNKWG
jgi:hypothetical protein